MGNEANIKTESLAHEPNKRRLSFEEFRLFYESAERVTDRRLELNRWNYSISIAILIAVALLVNWSVQSPQFIFVGLASASILCIIASFFCGLWVKQIRDYKTLNNAKWTILNEMAHRVKFDLDDAERFESYRPFEREWQLIDSMRGLQQWGDNKLKVLRHSMSEFFVPRAFQVLFVILLVILLLLTVGALRTNSSSSASQAVVTTKASQ